MNVFRNWHVERITKASPVEDRPGELLDNPDVAMLNFWLPRFVSEIRRQFFPLIKGVPADSARQGQIKQEGAQAIHLQAAEDHRSGHLSRDEGGREGVLCSGDGC